MVGIINIDHLRKLMYRTELYRLYQVKDLMEQPVATLHTKDPMSVVMDTFDRIDSSIVKLPVVDEERHFVGFVSKNKLYASYRNIMKDFSEE